MTAFIALLRKDLWLWAANRRALVMGLIAPIAIAAFFGYLFDSSRQKPSRIAVAVTDLDRSALSAAVVAGLAADTTLTLSPLPEAEAASAVTGGKLAAAIVLPAGLGEQAPGALFGAADKPEIVLRHDPSQPMALAVVQGLLAQHVTAAVGQAVFGGQGATDSRWLGDLRSAVDGNDAMPADQRRELQTMFDAVAKVQLRQVSAASAAGGAASAASANTPSASAAAVGGLGLPFTTRTLAATAQAGQAYNSYAHSFGGMGVQFILLMGVDVGMGVLLARRMGLWKRLRAAPISRTVLLGSRIASAALIAFGLLVAIFIAGWILFDVRIEGSVAGFGMIAAAFGLLTGSFGLLIAALGKTPEATRGLAILAMLLLVMLGGAWVPSFIFPAWLQTVSLAMPTRWAVDGLDAVTWRGLGLQAALLPTLVLLAFSAVFTLLAIWRFDWEEA
jgi:ABC-2 type transport system permease protein